MLHALYHIISRPLWQTPAPVVPATFLLAVAAADDWEDAYCFASTLAPGQQFAILLQAPVITKEAAQQIVPFFFLPQYKKPDQQPVVFIAEGVPLEERKACTDVARSQGYFISFRLLPEAEIIPYLNAAAITRVPENSDKAIYLKPVNWNQAMEMVRMLQEEEQRLAQQQPELYVLRSRALELQRGLQELQMKFAAAQQEISNQQAHIKTLQSGSQATGLQHFYNNEYEVLPKWYKRLGHLIKVMTGKRNLRSLFNDQVKKYKT
jgi:hypothetical protein